MNQFIKALYYDKKDPHIPEEYNFFGVFVGEWDIEWVDHLEVDEPRRVKGEWIFSWVLEGAAIQDVFIVPSRSERLQNKQPDAEYGTTLRIFNPKTSAWDIFYACRGEAIRLTAYKVGEDIILTENTTEEMRHVFSEITSTSFKWRKELKNASGKWDVIAKVRAQRAKG